MILALDISTKVGWACSDGRSGVIDLTRHKDDYAQMGREWGAWLTNLIYMRKPTLLVIERPLARRATDADYIMNGLVWVTHMTAHEAGIPRSEVSASSWRKVLFGKGNMPTKEAKARALQWCRDKGIESRDDNHADALCILAWAERCVHRPVHGDRGEAA